MINICVLRELKIDATSVIMPVDTLPSFKLHLTLPMLTYNIKLLLKIHYNLLETMGCEASHVSYQA